MRPLLGYGFTSPILTQSRPRNQEYPPTLSADFRSTALLRKRALVGGSALPGLNEVKCLRHKSGVRTRLPPQNSRRSKGDIEVDASMVVPEFRRAQADGISIASNTSRFGCLNFVLSFHMASIVIANFRATAI